MYFLQNSDHRSKGSEKRGKKAMTILWRIFDGF